MKNQCKPVFRGKWMALLLSMLLLLGMLPVPGGAAEAGSLNVKLTADTYARLPKDPAVEVTLYQIGEADSSTKSGWRVYDDFRYYGIIEAKTPSDLGRIAAKLEKDIAGKTQYKGKTKALTDGQASFSIDDYGIYFGMLASGPKGLEVQPFIVTVPSRDPETKQLRNSYDVVLKDSCVTSVTVEKVWKDADDQDGKRPSSIDVKLSNGKTVTLNDANEWKATIDNLPIYENGKEIEYTWTEAKVDGYISTQVTNGAITTLTNVHTPETTEVTIRKAWNDADDQDGLRPDHIDVTLSNGKTVTLNDANQWTATVTGLPKYANGQEIAYTWTEAKVDGYASTQVTDGTVTTLTNSHTPENPPPATTDISGLKIWVDESNAHKTRPASITVTLYADGQPVNATPTWRNTDTDRWTFTFAGLPAEDANGNAITYTVKETPVEGYTSTVTGTSITNELIPREPSEYKDLSGTKSWVEVDESALLNSVGQRPDFITVRLIRNGVEVASKQVRATDNWKYTFEHQPMDDGYGNAYEYTVREDSVTGFYGRVDGMDLFNTTLTRPDRPGTTTRRVLTRITDTPAPKFAQMTAEEVDDLMEMLNYNTPLWGQLLGTGDNTPVYPYVFGGVGVLAILALVIFGRKKKKVK